MRNTGSEFVKLSQYQIQKEEEEPSWSDVPVDILGLVLSRLFVGDAAAFSAVCKSWRSVDVIRPRKLPPPIPGTINDDDQLARCPCLLISDKLFHPLYNASFQMDIQKLPPAIIHVENHGWFLMAQGKSRMFFYHPLTNHTIDLPGNSFNSFKLITFSSPPTSPDCEIFRICPVVLNTFVVQTMKRGEQGFSYDLEFEGPDEFELALCNPVFYKGEYYCMGSHGNLVIYDPKTKKHRITGSAEHTWRYVVSCDCKHFMFEGEGDLWAVFIVDRGIGLRICKLNMENMVWEKVRNLKDRMVFISRTSCFMERTSVRGADNKIYFPKFRENNGLFYSLSTKKFHTFERGASYDSYHNSKQMFGSAWIKIDAQHDEISGKDLSW